MNINKKDTLKNLTTDLTEWPTFIDVQGLVRGWTWGHGVGGNIILSRITDQLILETISEEEWIDARGCRESGITKALKSQYREGGVGSFAKIHRDVGSHYRWMYRQKLTEQDLEAGYVTVNFDPYRVCKVWGVGGGPAEHMIKKAGRGVSKGHTEHELLDELQSCLNRWREMINEDS